MNTTNSFQKPTDQEEVVNEVRDNTSIEEVEDYFRTSSLARVSILPRWIQS
jgi:hypothetical protein